MDSHLYKHIRLCTLPLDEQGELENQPASLQTDQSSLGPLYHQFFYDDQKPGTSSVQLLMVVSHDLRDRHFHANRLGDEAQLGQTSILTSFPFGLVARVAARRGSRCLFSSLASGTMVPEIVRHGTHDTHLPTTERPFWAGRMGGVSVFCPK